MRTDTPPPSTSAFWSYAHDDDDHDGGRIRSLASDLVKEFAFLTGEPLEIFVDSASLHWGTRWKDRIDEALEATTFFIPVITPRYFMSVECRGELLSFATRAKQLGVRGLILPVYYSPVREFEPTSDDEVKALVATSQREDWRTLRFSERDSKEYRAGVNALAKRLVQVIEDLISPERSIVEVADSIQAIIGVGTSQSPTGDETEEPPEELDILAEGEEAMEAIAQPINETGQIIQEIGRMTEKATADLGEADRRGRGFAGRLTVARQLAKNLDPQAERLEGVSAQYASRLAKIDPAILTLLRKLEVDPVQREEAKSFLDGVLTLVANAREGFASTRGLIVALDSNAAMSRDLKRPVRRIQQALRNFTDGQNIFDEWARRIESLTSSETTQAGTID